MAVWLLHKGYEISRKLLKIYDHCLRKEAEKKGKCLERTKIAVRNWVYDITQTRVGFFLKKKSW